MGTDPRIRLALQNADAGSRSGQSFTLPGTESGRDARRGRAGARHVCHRRADAEAGLGRWRKAGSIATQPVGGVSDRRRIRELGPAVAALAAETGIPAGADSAGARGEPERFGRDFANGRWR